MTTPAHPAARPLRTVIRARISSDPDHNLSGVARQVRRGLAAIEANPARVLADDIPGSPVFRRYRRRRQGRKQQPDLAELAGLIIDTPAGPCWRGGIIVDNDAGAATKADGSRPDLPEYDRLTGYLIDGAAEAAWAVSLDRIWRSPAEFYDLVERKIPRRRVMIDVDGGTSYDLASPDAQIIVGVLAAFARLEALKTRQRIGNQMADYAELGRAHGRAPFGYTAMHLQPDGGMHAPQASESGACPACQGRKTGEWRTYAVVPAEAEALKDAARRALGGKPGDDLAELARRVIDGDPGLHPQSLYSILRVLDAEYGLPTREGLAWAGAGITSLKMALLNPSYTGRRPYSPGWGGKGHRPPEGKGTELYGNGDDGDAWEALWSPETLDALRLTLTSEKITITLPDGSTAERQRDINGYPGRPEPKHLLTGMIECWCGQPAFVQHNRSRPRYTCRTIMRGIAGQGQRHAVRAKADAEAEAVRRIMFWMNEGGLYDQARRSAESADVKQLRDELADAVAERRMLVRNSRLADMTDEEVRAETADVAARIAGLRVAIEAASRHEKLSALPGRAGFAAAWEAGDLATCRQVAEVLISRVVILRAPLVGGKPSDPRFTLVYPGTWAAGLADPSAADPAQPPADAGEYTSRGKARAYLAALPTGQLATAGEVAAGCGFPVYTARVALGKLLAAGEAGREWVDPAGGVTAADGSSRGLGGYGWHATVPGGPPAAPEPDAKGKALAYLRALRPEELASVAAVAAGSSISFRSAQRVLDELLADGEAERVRGEASGVGNGRRGRPPYGWRACDVSPSGRSGSLDFAS